MTWYSENKENALQWQRDYRKRKHDEVLENRRRYDKENREHQLELKYEWRKNNPVKHKVSKQKSDKKYRDSIKDTPEFKDKESKRGLIYRAKPDIKKHISEYNKTHSQIPEVKERRNETNRIWNGNNPERVLEKNIRYLSKLAQPVNMDRLEYGVAIMSWTKVVMKKFESLCQICSEKADHSHHLLFKALYPKLSLNINNGIPLCLEHHKEIHRLNTVQRYS